MVEEKPVCYMVLENDGKTLIPLGEKPKIHFIEKQVMKETKEDYEIKTEINELKNELYETQEKLAKELVKKQ